MVKWLIIGLGSMGKRRVRNLLALGIPTENIVGMDLRSDRRLEAQQKYGIATADAITADLLEQTGAFIVSTPPDQHHPYAEFAVTHGKPVFIEASVLDQGHLKLQATAEKKQLVVFPSCTMRFYPGPRRIKQWLQEKRIGRVYAWQYQSGQYLPDWHPWESIEDYYVSQRETGGCREIVPFELVWLVELFGEIVKTQAHRAKLSDLPADIDDIYAINFVHETGIIGQLMVDVLSRAPVRHIRITGEKGSIEWNDAEKRARYFSIDAGRWVEESLEPGQVEAHYINPEEPYIAEIKAFMECIKNKQSPDFSIQDDQKVLSVLYETEKEIV